MIDRKPAARAPRCAHPVAGVRAAQRSSANMQSRAYAANGQIQSELLPWVLDSSGMARVFLLTVRGRIDGKLIHPFPTDLRVLGVCICYLLY